MEDEVCTGTSTNIVLVPEPYPCVWIQGKGRFPMILGFPWDDKPIGLRDAGLWERFGNEIDRLASNWNAQRILMSVLFFVAFIGLSGLTIRRVSGMESLWVAAGFFAVVAGVTLLLDRVYTRWRNAVIDSTVASICDDYRPEFLPHGYALDYRTAHSKQGHHHTLQRVIVLVPTV